MTETKTTTRKPRTTRTKQDAVVETSQVGAVIEQPKVVIPEKRVITDDTKIAVMNNTTGMYGYKSATGSLDLFEYGDVGYITFAELRKMANYEKRHITDAFIVILDEDAIEELNYGKLYENILDKHGVNGILNNPERLEAMYSNMPNSMKETVISIARQRVHSTDLTERITDIRVVDVIKKVSGINILD